MPICSLLQQDGGYESAKKIAKPQSNSALCSWSELETKESFQIMLALTIEASPSRKPRCP
jgi:hypothetical protein